MEATRKGFAEVLSLRRLGLLLRRDFAGGYRGVLIAMATIGGLVILGTVLSAFSRNLSSTHTSFYIQLLFAGGFIVTSLTFKELHLNGQSIFYLTLPGSALEKFLSKLLVTSVGYAIGSLVFFTAVSSAAEGINRLIFGYGHPFFNPFDRNVLMAIAVYLVTQSVFLVGSVYFRKLAFVKTALYLVLLAIVLAIITGLGAWFLFREYAVGRTINLEPYIQQLVESGEMERVLSGVGHWFALIAKLLFWIVLAPIGWIISYLRLRETEV